MKKNLIISTIIIAAFIFFLCVVNSSKRFDEDQALRRFNVNEVITSNPVSDNEFTYVRTVDALYAINNSSGEQVWRAISEGDSPLALQPVLAENYIIVPEKYSRIAAFSLVSGDLLWRSPEIAPVFTSAELVNIEAIAAEENVAYVARFNWGITAYSLQSGNVIWDYDLQGRSNSYIALGEELVIIGSGDKITALHKHDGMFLWEIEINNGYVGPIVLDGDILIATDEKNSKLFLIDIKRRSVILETNLNIEPYEINCVFGHNEAIFISAQNLVLVAKESGQVVWKSKYVGRLECPIVWRDILIVRSKKTSLFFVNRNTGDVIGEYMVPYNSIRKHVPDRGMTLSNDLLLVLVDNHTLFAIDLKKLDY